MVGQWPYIGFIGDTMFRQIGEKMKIYKLQNGAQYWYDKSLKTWYAAKFDEIGNQIGNSFNEYQKKNIVLIAKAL